MKKIYILFLLASLAASANAQQEHQYTQFMYNKLLLNPAYAGARGVPFVTGIYRNQWMGFEGAPKSGLVSFNTPFLTERVGLGVTLSMRDIGLQRDFYGSFAYSYKVVEADELSIRIGLMGSIKSFSMDFAKANPLLTNDESLDNKRVNDTYGNVGAGGYALWREKFYVGFSVPHIYGNKIGLRNLNADLEAKESPHFYAMAGGSFPLNDQINILPSTLIKYVEHAPISFDLNCNFEIKKRFNLGLSYRGGTSGSSDSFDLLVYAQATPKIGVGLAYDFTLSQIKDYSNGSVELLFQVDLKQNKNNMSNPRFFF